MQERTLTEEERERLLEIVKDRDADHEEWEKALCALYRGLTPEQYEIRNERQIKEEELCDLLDSELEDQEANQERIRALSLELRELRMKDLAGAIDDLKREINEVRNMFLDVTQVLKVPGWEGM